MNRRAFPRLFEHDLWNFHASPFTSSGFTERIVEREFLVGLFSFIFIIIILGSPCVVQERNNNGLETDGTRRIRKGLGSVTSGEKTRKLEKFLLFNKSDELRQGINIM